MHFLITRGYTPLLKRTEMRNSIIQNKIYKGREVRRAQKRGNHGLELQQEKGQRSSIDSIRLFVIEMLVGRGKS